MSKPEDKPVANPQPVNDEPALKGDLEKLMGTALSHYPISLWDHDEAKLKKEYNQEEMYKKFYKKYIETFKFPTDKDDYRPSYANTYYGGIDFPDAKTTSLIRSMGWELIKIIGKKILSGDFNLTTVTIPIKVMVPISILQHVINGHTNFPLYLDKASLETDPLERMKLVITASMSSWFRANVFLKPLNPILGETYEMMWEDGSHEYVEQTCHHPPCSNFIIYGPNNLYKYYGYLCFESNAWINSLKLTNSGKREIVLKDGTKYQFNYPIDNYYNTFWGCIRIESTGDLFFKDLTNGIETHFSMGGYGHLSDYFEGTIVKGDKELSKFSGSFLGHIDFDGVRYWDIRRNIDIESFPVKKQIPSSSIYREDSILLYQKKLDDAQAAKDKLENIQRNDRKLREKYNKA